MNRGPVFPHPAARSAILDERPIQTMRQFLGFIDPKKDTPPRCPPMARIRLIGRPQIMFKPQRFWFPPEDAPFFELLDFSIGRNRQLMSTEPLKCSTFLQWPEPPKDISPEELERFYRALHEASSYTFDTAQPGLDVAVELRNIDPVREHSIYCTVEGLGAF